MAKLPYKIAVIPGDGIGKEVTAEAIKILKKVEEKFSIDFEFIDIPGGGQYYLETGFEWPEGSFELCKYDVDSIFLGAVGWPGADLPDGNIAGAGIVFGLRFGLDLYANVRPTKLFPGIYHKIHGEKRQVWTPGKVDLVTVRENTEGLYTPIRGSLNRGGVEELAIDSKVTTAKGASRLIEYGYRLAEKRNGAPRDGLKRVTCVDKSNVLQGCRLFRSIYDEIGKKYPSIAKDYAYIDAYLQWLIRDTDFYDVIVTSNMFGDIASDLSSVLAGSLGMSPSGNIGDRHALFEPVHGSAPKHAGKNKANPIAAILSAGMMLDYLGTQFNNSQAIDANIQIENAIIDVIKENKVLTYDLGGNSSCSELGAAISSRI
jgi:3-isopropylmalate dehydrogenase